MKRINQKSQTKRFHGRCSPEFKEFLQEHATRLGTSKTDLLEIALRNFVESGLLWWVKCRKCGNLEPRDERGYIAKMYVVSDPHQCKECGYAVGDEEEYYDIVKKAGTRKG